MVKYIVKQLYMGCLTLQVHGQVLLCGRAFQHFGTMNASVSYNEMHSLATPGTGVDLGSFHLFYLLSFAFQPPVSGSET